MATNGTLPAYQSQLPIAVDAMGGDKGLEVVVEGAVAAHLEFGVRSILVGPKETLKARLSALGASQLPIEIFHASETIEMGESPTRAVRKKPDSSLCVAYQLVQTGRASAVISAGNSGAMMAAGRIICGLLSGIERPAIATLIPVAGEGTPNVILDAGANVDCNAHNLVQFAIMGSRYSKALFGKVSPTVGLLSNGTEPSKGTDVLRAAALELSKLKQVNYIGYVEGRDIPTDKADVIVCDGFVGNVVLKALEGSVRLIFNQLLHEGKKGLFRKFGLGLSRGLYKEVFLEKFDYSAHGGAPLLGLCKLALVLHGASDVRAVKNAIRVADSFAQKQMVEKLAAELSQLEEESVAMDNGLFSSSLAASAQVESEEELPEDAPLQAPTPKSPLQQPTQD